MQVNIIDNTQMWDWDAYTASHQDACFADLLPWRRLVARHFNLRPFVLGVRADGSPNACLSLFEKFGFGKKLLLGSPMSASGGGVLWDSDDAIKIALSTLEKKVIEEKLSYAQIYLPRPLPVLPKSWQQDERFVRVVLPLQNGAQNIWEHALRDKTRNQIRKAEKYNFTFVEGAEYVDAFHHVLNYGTRDLGSPCPSVTFFKDIAKTFPDTAKFIVAMDGKKPAAAALLLHHNGHVAIPWAITLRSYRETCLNSLLYWRIVEHACEKGASVLDMGRSLAGSGTCQFKVHFGGKAQSLYYYYHLPNGKAMPDRHPENSGFSIAQNIWRRLPAFLTARLGHYALKQVL